MNDILIILEFIYAAFVTAITACEMMIYSVVDYLPFEIPIGYAIFAIDALIGIFIVRIAANRRKKIYDNLDYRRIDKENNIILAIGLSFILAGAINLVLQIFSPGEAVTLSGLLWRLVF